MCGPRLGWMIITEKLWYAKRDGGILASALIHTLLRVCMYKIRWVFVCVCACGVFARSHNFVYFNFIDPIIIICNNDNEDSDNDVLKQINSQINSIYTFHCSLCYLHYFRFASVCVCCGCCVYSWLDANIKSISNKRIVNLKDSQFYKRLVSCLSYRCEYNKATFSWTNEQNTKEISRRKIMNILENGYFYLYFVKYAIW